MINDGGDDEPDAHSRQLCRCLVARIGVRYAAGCRIVGLLVKRTGGLCPAAMNK